MSSTDDPNLDRLEQDLKEHMENQQTVGSRDTPILLESEDEDQVEENDTSDAYGSREDQQGGGDSDIEIIDMDGQLKHQIVYDEDMDSDEVEEIMMESQPNDLEQRKGFSGFTCPVCMDTPKKTIVTPCGHMYCSDCGLRALSSTVRATERKGECSICRRKIDYKQLTFLEMKLAG